MDKKEKSVEEKEHVREIVKLLSRGSLTLRLGQYETQEDLDARREALKKFEF